MSPQTLCAGGGRPKTRRELSFKGGGIARATFCSGIVFKESAPETSTTSSAELKPDDLTSMDVFRAVQAAGAFDFWDDPGEDLYHLKDGEPK